MKQIMNKLFKRNLMIKEDQVEFDPTFDLDLRTMVAAVIPGEGFEEQLETQILEIAAAKNKTSTHESTQKQAGWFSLNTSVKKFSLVGLTIILIIAVSLLVSPSLRVMAENLFSFWKKVDNQQVITPFPEVPAIDPEEIPAIVESLQEEIKSTQLATATSEEEFIIKLPTLLPEGHRILVVDRGPRGNAFLNLSKARFGALITVTIRPAIEVEGTILGPEGKVEKVTIGDITYEYVRGGWGIGNALSNQMDPDAVKDLSWIDDYDGFHKLRWFDGNMNYYMVVAGDNMPGSDRYFGKNDLVKIASSFQPLENGARPPLEFFEPDYGIDEKLIEQIKDISILEDLVRFDIPEATFLPGGFRFKGGIPVFTGNHVILNYSCASDAISSEEMVEIGLKFSIGRYSESALAKEFEMFGGYEIGEDAIIETILINDIEVQFVQGDWNRTSGERTWDSNQNHFKMVWYKDGLLYNIHNREDHESYYQGSCALTKEDLIKFVEGLQ